MKLTYQEAKDRFWANLFSRAKNKAQAFKVAQLIADKQSAWSASNMTLDQFEEGSNMLNNYSNLLKELHENE